MSRVHIGRKAPKGFREKSAQHLGCGIYAISIKPCKHFWSIPDKDGKRECLWCRKVMK